MSKDSREIDRIASLWLVRRDSGTWSEEEAASLESWLNASTVHRVAFLRLELGWEETRRLKALAAGVRTDSPPSPGQWNLSPFFDPVRATAETAAATDDPPRSPGARHRPVLRRLSWALAASAVLAAVAITVGSLWPRGERYTTPVGGIASVPMPDGSKITLNTNTRVQVALTAAERRVDLEQGEAFFEVAKDASRPFVVEAGKKRVVAVGTQFSVRRDHDSLEVVVTEGKVRVEDATEPSPNGAGSAQRDRVPAPLLLTSGTIARASANGVLIQRTSLSDAEAQLSWRVGVLTFRNATLAEAIQELNRYTVRKIVIADSSLASLKIEGNFSSDNAPAFVELLQAGFPIRVTEEPDRIVLTAK